MRLLFLVSFLSFSLSSCLTKNVRSDQNIPKKQAADLSARPNVPTQNSGEALYSAALKFYQLKDYQKSYDYSVTSFAKLTSSPKEIDAHIVALRSAMRIGKLSEAIAITDILLKKRELSQNYTQEVLQTRLKALDQLGDYFSSLSTIEKMKELPFFAKDKDSFKIKSEEIIQNKLSFQDLSKVQDDSQFLSLRGNAAFRLGELSLEERNISQARNYFSMVLSYSPQTEIAKRAEDYLAQLDAVRRVEPKTIGVVLPMTGKYSSVSIKVLRALEMGLGLSGNISTFKLAVVDSEGNPDTARKGVERLVKEDNVIAVIGSVLSKNAPAVAAKANELGVPSIALSQKSGITELGPYTFRNALTSEMQVRYLVKTAFEQQGLRKFAILYPNDSYGVEFANIFWDEVLARGGQITAAQVYSPKETDFREPIQRLVGTYYIEDRVDEYKFRVKEWSESQTKKSARNSIPEDLLSPIVDFDGIFIPDSAKSLGQISAMLAYNGIKNVKLLGTNLWNVPGIAKRAGHSIDQMLFVDSFVNSDVVFNNSQFVKEYKAQFEEDPGVVELQAYDSALLLRQLISQGASSRESLANALVQIKNFPGAIGPLTISAEREIQRPLVALTILNGSIVPLNITTQK